MTRIEGWERRLNAVIDGVAGREFEWGVSDCATLAADAVIACTGIDPLGSFRGAYRDAESLQALCLQAADGFTEFVEWRLVESGASRVAPGLAQRGDIAVAVHEGNLVVGVVMIGCIVTRVGIGTARLPIAAGQVAWRI